MSKSGTHSSVGRARAAKSSLAISLRRLAVAVAATILVVGAAPARAAFPGENGRIVFDTAWTWFNGQGMSEIYSVAPDGSHLRRLTHMGPDASAWHPAVSPDASLDRLHGQRREQQRPGVDHAGRRIPPAAAWSTSPTGVTAAELHRGRTPGAVLPVWRIRRAFYRTCKIVSVRLNGSGMRTIIGGTWHPSDPVMSPDGSQIAYVSDAGGYEARIWLADVDGGHQRPLVGTAFVERISWSPDGTPTRVHGLPRRRPVHDRGRRDRSAVWSRRISLFAAWSPDGTRIVWKVEGAEADLGFGPLTDHQHLTGPIRWTSWTPRWASATRIGGSHDETSRAMDDAVLAPRCRTCRRRRPAHAAPVRAGIAPTNGRILFTHCEDRAAVRSTRRTRTAPRSSRSRSGEARPRRLVTRRRADRLRQLRER